MKVIVYVSTDKVGSLVEKTIEIDETELEGMSKSEISDHIEMISKEHMFEMIEWGWAIKGE